MIEGKKNDNAGVHIPPPLFYIVLFLLSILIQNIFPINENFYGTTFARIIGLVLIVIGLILDIPALVKFIQTKNTVVTIKPAKSLQTSGIYALTRNPMYLGLLLLYSGLALYIGNWWTIILIPVLILTINYYVIKNEEKYLERAFGKDFLDYSKKVRRWI